MPCAVPSSYWQHFRLQVAVEVILRRQPRGRPRDSRTPRISATPTAMSRAERPGTAGRHVHGDGAQGRHRDRTNGTSRTTARSRPASPSSIPSSSPAHYTVTLTVQGCQAGNFNRASVMVSVNEGGTCSIVPAAFSSTVWPAMSSGPAACTTCHRDGRRRRRHEPRVRAGWHRTAELQRPAQLRQDFERHAACPRSSAE